jgi:type I restriction enzyme S subunit
MKRGWKTKSIGDLSELITKGNTPTSIGYDFVPKGINFVKVEAISLNGVFINEKMDHINSECYSALKRSQLKEGDILFSIAGALGRTAIVTNNILPANINQALAIIRLKPDESISKRYVLKALETGFVLEQIEKFKGGVAQQNLSLAQIHDLLIPIPSLNEQQRIVSILDEGFADIDTAKANTEKNKQNVRELFETYLNNTFSNPGEGWEEKKLENVCVVERGSSPRPIKKYLTKDSDGVNWIKIGDTKNVEKYILFTKEKITPEGAKKSRFVKEGDFILSNSMSFGKPFIMKTKGYIHDGWFVLRLPNSIDTEFFWYLLFSPYTRKQFESLASGAIVKNISSNLVKKVILPIPPLLEQKKLACEFDAFSTKIKKLDVNYQQKIVELEELKKSLLQQAFNGELTEG